MREILQADSIRMVREGILKLERVLAEHSPAIVGAPYHLLEVSEALRGYESVKHWAMLMGVDVREFDKQVRRMFEPYFQSKGIWYTRGELEVTAA